MTSTAPILKPISDLLAAEEAVGHRRPMMEEGETSTPIVYRVCSWCKRGLGVVRAVTLVAGSITHTVCPACSDNLLQGLDRRRPSCQRSPMEARQ